MICDPTPITPYTTVLMDPPWNERGAGKYKRGADRYYPLMGRNDILRTILRCEFWDGIAPNAHMYLWVTNTFLPDGLWLMDALGFKYKSNFVRAKEGNIGLGQYFRGQHELCLFGTKGRRPTEPRTERRNLSSLVCAPRGAHSEKPQPSYELIEARSKGPYLELFARQSRPGWTAWGNEL